MAVDIGPRIGIDGEAEFRRQIQNVSQQVKTLGSEMGAVAAKFSSADDAEEKNAKTAKLLSEQISAQQKKLELLRDGLQKSAEKYGETDSRTLKWRQSVAEATTALEGMRQKSAATGDAVETLGDSAEDAGEKTEKTGDTLKKAFTGAAVVAGITAIAAGLKKVTSAAIDAAKETAALGDNIDKQSQKLGMSRKGYQQIGYALDKYGMDVDILQAGLKTLSTQAEKNAAAFDQLGISQDQLKNASPEDLFERVVFALQDMEEGTTRTALASQLLGKSATELAPLLNSTRDEYEALKKEAPLMSDATVDASAKMTDAMSAYNSTMSEIKSSVTAQVMPAITRSLDTVRKKLSTGSARAQIDKAAVSLGKMIGKITDLSVKAIPKVIDGAERLSQKAGSLATAVGGIFVAAKGYSIVSSLTSALKGASGAMAGLNAAMSANPIGVLVSSVGVLIGVLGTLDTIGADVARGDEYLDDEQKAVAASAATAAEKIGMLSDARMEATKTADAQADRENALWRELQNLTDETGKVKSADADRAKYILGELNTALGTEYEMTGNQISRYREMRAEVAKLVQQKQANALLDANQESYTAAKSAIDDAISAAAAQTAAVQAAKDAYDAALKAYDAAVDRGELNEMLWDDQAAIDRAKEQYDASLALLADKNAVVSNFATTISRYEAAQTAATEGNYNAAIGYLTSETRYRWQAAKERGKIQADELAQLKKDADGKKSVYEYLLDALERHQAGVTEDMVDTARRDWQDLQNIYDGAVNGAYDYGIRATNAIADALGNGKSAIMRKTDDIVNSSATVLAAGVGKIDSAAVQLTGAIKSKFQAAIDAARSDGAMIAKGLADGMASQDKYLRAKSDRIVAGMLEAIEARAEIHSPSRAAYRDGAYVVQGLINALHDGRSKVADAASNIADAAVGGIRVNAGVTLASSQAATARGNATTIDCSGMTVYVSGGQSVEGLADAVATQIYRRVVDAQGGAL